jgi:DNA polymerase-1
MINYGIAYGLSAYGLAQRLKLEKSEAHAIIERYFSRYAGVKAWLDRVLAEARRDGWVRTLFGRRRRVPDLSSRNPALRSAAERAAVNHPIQGTAADLVKRAMLGVERAIAERGLAARMLLQIHDELLLEAPVAEVAEASALVRGEMERAASLAVPLVVEVGAGESWGDAH